MLLLWAHLLIATPAGAPDLADFARCLTRAGATFYTADWCPHCARQSEMFGAALRYVRTVDCSQGCDGVESLPTWTFRDGSAITGVASLQTLARRTGCRIGREPDGALDDLRRSEALHGSISGL
jgi:hypothetical protein